MDQHRLCFETLANELRLEILRLLEKGAMNVSEIATATKAERTRVSHALQMLRDCKLLEVTKKGRENVYTLNEESPIVKKKTGTLFTIVEEHALAHCDTCHKHGCEPGYGK